MHFPANRLIAKTIKTFGTLTLQGVIDLFDFATHIEALRTAW
jgi:hypothetical protein